MGALSRAAAVLAVLVAAVAGGLGALAAVSADRDIGVATVRLSVAPFHDGALDVYVPVVDWGARFPAVRFPARIEVDVRAVDRREVRKLASGGSVDVAQVRARARDAIAGFLRLVLVIGLLAAVAAGAVAALAVRGHGAPRLRWLLAAGALGSVAWTAVLAVTLPPRGPIADPQYYAYGPDIPRALDALNAIRGSTRRLDQELDAQLVGLANLVIDPARRAPVSGRPRFVAASDLHNNVLAVPLLERTARGGPILFAGDLTDRGSPLETSIVRRIVRAGKPFVFVSGNHDSDALRRELARDGAVVLDQAGRYHADGSRGAVVQRVGGLRVAGYSDPFERRSSQDFADRYRREPPPEAQVAFADWLRGLRGKVDVVVVHAPKLAALALRELRTDPPSDPLVLVAGHTHRVDLQRIGPVTLVNGGSVGAGGTGNLGEGTPIGLAVVTYARAPRFAPLAADLVVIDPATGSSTARRERLDAAPAAGRGA